MKNLKVGQIYQQGSRKELYKVLDVVTNNVQGFKREEVVMGCLRTNEAVSMPQAKIDESWKFLSDSDIQTQYVKRKVFLDSDNRIVVLSEKLIDPPKQASQKKGKDKPATAIQIAMEEAQAKQNKKVVNIGHITNIHENKKVEEEKELDVLDYRNFASCTYEELSLLGNVFGDNPDTVRNCSGKFQRGMKALHLQCLDRFRENNISIADLRGYCPNRQTGNPLTLSGTINRLNKAIWHFGTVREKKLYGWG